MLAQTWVGNSLYESGDDLGITGHAMVPNPTYESGQRGAQRGVHANAMYAVPLEHDMVDNPSYATATRAGVLTNAMYEAAPGRSVLANAMYEAPPPSRGVTHNAAYDGALATSDGV